MGSASTCEGRASRKLDPRVGESLLVPVLGEPLPVPAPGDVGEPGPPDPPKLPSTLRGEGLVGAMVLHLHMKLIVSGSALNWVATVGRFESTIFGSVRMCRIKAFRKMCANSERSPKPAC